MFDALIVANEKSRFATGDVVQKMDTIGMAKIAVANSGHWEEYEVFALLGPGGELSERLDILIAQFFGLGQGMPEQAFYALKQIAMYVDARLYRLLESECELRGDSFYWKSMDRPPVPMSVVAKFSRPAK